MRTDNKGFIKCVYLDFLLRINHIWRLQKIVKGNKISPEIEHDQDKYTKY